MGNAGSLAGIAGALFIETPNYGYMALNVDDSADAATHANVVVTAGTIAGLAPVTIDYNEASLSRLNIRPPAGSREITLTSAAQTTASCWTWTAATPC